MIAWLVLALSARRSLLAETAPSEYELKAALLYSFSKFVDWPPAAFPLPDAPLRICIVGKDPFGKAMFPLQSKTVSGHPIQFEQLSEVVSARACQMVFISGSEKKHLDSILRSIGTAPVLTVGDTPGFAKAGVMINLLLEDEQIRFEVNLTAAEQSHVNLNSKLLALARSVIRAADSLPVHRPARDAYLQLDNPWRPRGPSCPGWIRLPLKGRTDAKA